MDGSLRGLDWTGSVLYSAGPPSGTPCRLSVWRAKAKMNGSSPGAAMSDFAILGTYSVFLASYIVFALGKFPGMKIDRPGAAIIGAVLMFMTGAVRAENSLHLIHFGTIVLLFSMMLVVAYLHLAGFFDWVTELAVMRLKPHHLLSTVMFLSIGGGSNWRRIASDYSSCATIYQT